MSGTLAPGLRHTLSLRVDERQTVPAMSPFFPSYAEMPPVFATAFLVGFVEWVAVEALRPFLEPGQRSVGIHVDLSHVAATPVGMTVTAEVEVVALEGARVRFRVICRDEAEVISEGHHERFIIDGERFMARLARKRDAAPRG